MDSSSSSSFSQYKHLSMINVGNFVSIKLTKVNYVMWEAQMRSLIVSQNLVGFIDGQNVAPPQSIIVQPHVHVGYELTAEIENPEYQAWRRTDLLLKGWIIGSLSKEVLGAALVEADWKSDTARDVWTNLARMFPPHPHQELETPSESVEITSETPSESDEIISETPSESDEIISPHPHQELETQSELDEVTDAEGRGFEFTTEQKGKIEELFEAIKSGQRFSVVKNLVESMSSQELAQQDEETSFTALHGTALAGNVQLAKLLVKKAPLLPNIKTSNGNLPLHFAADCSHREMTSYLMKVAKDEKKTKPFEGRSGVFFLRAVMTAKFYGVALDLLQKNPKLAWPQQSTVSGDPSDVALDLLEDEDNSASQLNFAVLDFMAQDPSSFPSGRRMNILQRLIYSCQRSSLHSLSFNITPACILSFCDRLMS